ncbi:hypothetical protein D3C87_2020790 [compost metagenome]
MSLTKFASAWRVLPTSCWYLAAARSLMAALSVSSSDAYSENRPCRTSASAWPRSLLGTSM